MFLTCIYVIFFIIKLNLRDSEEGEKEWGQRVGSKGENLGIVGKESVGRVREKERVELKGERVGRMKESGEGEREWI